MFTSSCTRLAGVIAAAFASPLLLAQTSGGPAVGMPMAINSRDAQGDPLALLHFKRPGLDQAAAEPVTDALNGPGAPVATGAELHWASPDWQLQSAGVPGPYAGHLMVHDPAQGALLLLDTVGLMWTWNGSTWTNLGTTTWPTRSNAAAVADPSTNSVFMFGGSNGLVMNDTWQWNGTTWIPLIAATAPPPRARHTMAFDGNLGRVILFGGIAGTSSLGDTWALDTATNSWTLLANSGPAPRNGHAMAFDANRGRIVLFGGIAGSTTFGDTWEWDGVAWTQQTPSASPAARHRHRMVYDQARQRILVHGGRPSSPSATRFNETWEYDGSHWCETQRDPTMTGRADHAMAFDPASGTTVVHGGNSPTGNLADTWSRDAGNEPLGINDFSLGLDWIPADANTPGLVDVPTESWIGMAFSVREGAVGRPGSRLAQEPPVGIGSDLFTYVFHGSDPVCLPGHEVGEVSRAADGDEGLVGGGTPSDINGFDVFLPAYHNGPNYTGNPLPQVLSVYFTVARTYVDRAPVSWWSGSTPSAASILVSQWDPVEQHWSCPSLWRAHAAIMVPDAAAPSGYSPLHADEEIDALAVGRSDGLIGAPTFVVFSTNLEVPPSVGSRTKAPDQLMISEPGSIGGPVYTAVMRVTKPDGSTSKASEEAGLDSEDDVDACATWDPCMRAGSSATPRNIFDRRIGLLQDPPPLPLLGIPIGSGSIYRQTAGGSDLLTSVCTSSGGLIAVLYIAPDVTNPLNVVPGPFVLMTPGGVGQFSVPIPVGILGAQIMVHQVTIDALFGFERSTSVITF